MRVKLLIFISAILLTISLSGKVQAYMFWNQACIFAGTSTSYVAFKDTTFIDITSSFTIEAWINPVNSASPGAQILVEKREGAMSNGYTLYLLNGAIAIRTNSVTRLPGNIIIPNNKWTHVAGTYDGPTNRFSIYIDGVLDTTAVVTSAAPISNQDSLRIGKGFNSPFHGVMDEVRIWRRSLSLSEISSFRRTSLAATSGTYNSLIFSLTFQKENSYGIVFSLEDRTKFNGTGRNNGVSALDLSKRPSVTIAPNESVELDGAGDYLFGADNSNVSPTNFITMEAWIYPRSLAGTHVIMQKGQMSKNYGLRLSGSSLNATINNNTGFVSTAPIKLNQWTHVAFSYSGTSGKFNFYSNGNKTGEGVNFQGPITDGSDNLFLGSNGTSTDFYDGFIDEVRISNYIKSQNEIKKFLFQSIDQSNEPNSSSINVVYNLDGYPDDNADSGPELHFAFNAEFSHSSAVDNKPVSPLNRQDALFFSNGFNLKNSNKAITDSSLIDWVFDTLKVNLDTIINDINVYVAIEHTGEQDLDIYLVAPNGESVQLFDNNFLVQNSDNVITVFDDQSDSSVLNNGRYVSYSPNIKPKNSLNSKFAGDKTAGNWKLMVGDFGSAGAGRIISWGIQFNNVAYKIPGMALRVFNQGFYRETDTCVADTITIHLRRGIAPYNDDVGIKDETPDDDNIIHSNFVAADFDQTYYIEVEHRNSIETWSSAPAGFEFLSGNFDIDFTVNQAAAFGSNQIQVDDTPLRFAIYSGDINQDDAIDLADVLLAFNDATLFVSGYSVSDVNGDMLVDLTDIIITSNNSNNFITTMKPG